MHEPTHSSGKIIESSMRMDLPVQSTVYTLRDLLSTKHRLGNIVNAYIYSTNCF